jgi:hypothetical protein
MIGSCGVYLYGAGAGWSPAGECGEDSDNLSSVKEFCQVEAGFKRADEEHAAEGGPRIKILAEDGSQTVHFGGGP